MCSQQSKPEASVARNQTAFVTEWRKNLGKKTGSVEGTVLLWSINLFRKVYWMFYFFIFFAG